MLITVQFGSANSGLSVYYRVLNADKSEYAARTATGVTELVSGSGTYGVNVADGVLNGRTVVWDIDATSKTASETFPLDAAVTNGAVNDGAPTASSFVTNLTEATDSHYVNCAIQFTTGALVGQARKISAYNGTTKLVTVSAAFTDVPANGDQFIITGLMV